MTSLRSSIRFGPLTIAYDDRVLEPRPWTALQSEWAAELAGRGDEPLLELCTGAGHIGLLAAELTGRPLVAVDLDEHACTWCRSNAADAGLGDRVTVRQGAVDEVLAPGEVFALAIADPPWVTSDRIGVYPADPVLAIDGGADGLQVARACVAACLDHLPGGGSLLVQLGDEAQARTLLDDVAAQGWTWGGLRTGERGVVVRLLHP